VDEAEDCCWGIVWCCFCGEFEADEGICWGELMLGVEVLGLAWGFVTDGGALEYNVPPEFIDDGPLGVFVMKVYVLGGLLPVLPVDGTELNGP